MNSGFLKLSRKFVHWRWYTDVKTKMGFVYILLHAEWKLGSYMGQPVRRGQSFLSVRRMAADLKMTERNVRTILDHLQETGEIVTQATPLGSLVTVSNFETYQSSEARNYIKLYRQMPGWNWLHNTNDSAVMLHLMLTARAYTKEADGRLLENGQISTRLPTLCEETGLSLQNMRTSLKHLREQDMISCISSNRGLLLTVRAYDTICGLAKLTGRLTCDIDEIQHAKTEKLTGTYGAQTTHLSHSINGLSKPTVLSVYSVANMPRKAYADTRPDEKRHTACCPNDTLSDKSSIIEENLKTGEEGKSARTREESPTPLPQKQPHLRAVSLPVTSDKPALGDTPSANRTSLPTADDIATLYQSLCPSLSLLPLPLTRRQRAAVTALINELHTSAGIHSLFLKAGQSTFLSGQTGDGVGWCADFDWIIKPDHAHRILAGAYDGLFGKRRHRQCYIPKSENTPTYDMNEFIALSMQRLLGDQYNVEPAEAPEAPPGSVTASTRTYDMDEYTALSIRRVMGDDSHG